MRNKNAFTTFTFTLLCVCVFSSCTEKNNNEITIQEQQAIDLTETIRTLIVGRWQSVENDDVTIEFTPGGSIIINDYPYTQTGSYTINGKKLIMHFNVTVEEFTIVNLDEKYLEMDDTVDGTRLVFRRIS